MIRKLNILGLCAIAMLATGAAAASRAGAETEFTAGKYPAFLTGTQIIHEGSELHKFTFGIRTVECGKAQFSGTLSGASTTVTLTPTYSECTSAGLPATITMNGCDFLFRGENKVNGDSFFGSVNLVCPAKSSVELHVYSSLANHAAGTSLCTATLSPASILNTIRYTNTTEVISDMDVTATVTKIPTAIDGSPLFCGTSTTTSYTGGFTLRAFEDNFGSEGGQIAASMS